MLYISLLSSDSILDTRNVKQKCSYFGTNRKSNSLFPNYLTWRRWLPGAEKATAVARWGCLVCERPAVHSERGFRELGGELWCESQHYYFFT